LEGSVTEPAGLWCQVLGGSTEVWWQGAKVRVGGRQQRAVLTALLLHPHRTVRAERLVELVWGDDPPPSAGKSLQVLVSRLRRCLADVVGIETGHGGYRATVDADRVDLFRFRALQERARQTGDRTAQALLMAESVDLVHDAALADLSGTPAGDRVRAGVAAEHLAAVERHLRLRLADGAGGELLPQVAELAAKHPLHEGFAALLMRALRAAGRAPEALAVFADTRATLADELGTEPGPALRELHAELLAADDRTETPPVRRPAQLPRAPLHFTGRQESIGELSEHLVAQGAGVPVVVISGPGGVGKTSLAAKVGNEVRASFPDGQLYAALRGQQAAVSAGSVLAELLHSLGTTQPEVPPTLTARSALLRSLLADRRVLLVLDDAADAAQVRPLLPAGNGCAVLVTSRNRLPGLDASSLHILDPLSRHDSLQLLSGIVGASRIAAERDAAIQVADRCAGLPLALRIVGSRLAARPAWRVVDLARRLASTARLDELHGGDIELRSTFQLSYQHLAPGPATVFRAGATPPVDGLSWGGMAALVDRGRPETRVALETLVDLNLLQETAADRFRYHDLIHDFAADLARRQESPSDHRAMLRRLFGYYVTTGRRTTTLLHPGIPARRMPVPNLPGGAHAEDFGSRDAALSWLAAEHRNCTVVATALLDDAVVPASAFSQIVTHLSTYCTYQGSWSGLSELLDGALRRARRDGDRLAEAYVLKASASPMMPGLTATQAVDAMRRAADLYGDLGDPAMQACLLSAVAGVWAREGDGAKAELLLQRAMRLSRDLDEPDAYVTTLVNLSDIELTRGRHAHAARQARSAINAAESAQLHHQASIARINLAEAQAALGDHRDARHTYRQVLNSQDGIDNLYFIAEASLGLARSCAADDDLAAAINNYQRALEVHRRTMARSGVIEGIRRELAGCYDRIGRHHLTTALSDNARRAAG
jgi:DNA-binding SARP family transcriptional activator/tetratricopeptide (TPR) repeat protein